jgi:hypothetical protein
MTFSLLALFIIGLLHRLKHTKGGGNRPINSLLFSEVRSRFLLEIEGQCHKICYKTRKGRI